MTVWAMIAARRGWLALLVALMLASAATEGLGLLLFVPMFAVIAGGTGSRMSMAGGRAMHVLGAIGVPTTLAPLLVLFVALVLLRGLVNHERDLAGQRLVGGTVDALRSRAWKALLQCEWQALSAMRRSDGTSLLITEVERFGYGLGQLIGAVGTLLTLGGLTLAALVIAPAMTAAALTVGAAVLLVYVRAGGGVARANGERLSAAHLSLHAAFAEGLGALRVIKSFGHEAQAAADGAAAAARLRLAERRFLAGLGRGQIALQASGAACLAGFVWLAVTHGVVDRALVLPLVALALRALPLLAVLHHTWQNWMYARPALARTADLIARAKAAREPEPAADGSAPPVMREIALQAVTVHFAGQPHAALDRVTLTLPTGTITALIGASGAGKSTVADVLGGLLVPQQGSLAIDGIPLGGTARRGWRQRVAYVQQDAWLSAGSLRDNLRWADPAADDARMVLALQQAAAEFALVWPEGLATRLGDGGRALSGGERQRIVMARALLRDPALLILDEATSALDIASEQAIAEAVAALRGSMTILVIGHRGALTALADHTVQLQHGRVLVDTDAIK